MVATSNKQQATSNKQQATSNKQTYVKYFMDAVAILLLRISYNFPKPVNISQKSIILHKTYKVNHSMEKKNHILTDPPFDIRLTC